MQVRKVLGRAHRTFKRLHVRLELNQIPRNEACGQAQMPQNLDQKPSGIAT